jgi:hypothetical protein
MKMKRIREEILNRCSSIEAFCVAYYTSTLRPTCRGLNACVRVPLIYKRETLARGGAEDRLILKQYNSQWT